MKKLVCSLVAALALGCGYYPECGAWNHDGRTDDGPMCERRLQRELTISSDFTPEQQEAIMQAGDDWAEWTDFRVALSWRISDDEADVAPFSGRGDSVAEHWSSSGRIAIIPTLELEKFRHIIGHELGHSFGLGHVSDTGQCMHPNSNAPISAADVEHFNRLWPDRVR